MNHRTAALEKNHTPNGFFSRVKPRLFRRQRLLIAGCGQVGFALLSHDTTRHFIATCRPGEPGMDKRTRIRQHGAQALPCDLSRPRDLLKALSLAHRVLWMAAPDTATAVDNTLKRLALYAAARSQAWHKPRLQLTYISTTGVYGNAEGQWIDERTPVNPVSDRARRRVHAEQQLRLSNLLGHSAHILRAPGIYGHARLPLDRIRAGIPAIVDTEDSWSNHIHELDLGRMSVWCNFKGGAWRVVNACDSEPCKMGDYFDAVADAYRLERPPRLPRLEVKKQVSPMMWSFMAESRRIRSIEQTKLGFRLLYPSVGDFLSKHAA